MNTRSIGFFDSGIGGLTVLSEAVRRMPQEQFIYYADTAHVPYGTKPKDEVRSYVLEAAAQMVERGIKALVVACNTATSIAIAELRALYPIPVIGMEPAIKPAVEMMRECGKRVLVMATPLTLQESKFNALVARIDDTSIVDSLPLPELVGYCEQLIFDPEVMEPYFRGQLAPYNLEHYGTIVLGCTHYPFYRELLAGMLPAHIQIIDGSCGTVGHLQNVLQQEGLLSRTGTGEIRFMCSAADEAYLAKLRQAYGIYSHMAARREG